MPDLNNPGEVVALLRDTQRLAFDLIDNPEPILPAIEEANQAWYRYWQAANGVVHQWIGGYFFWMGLWSDVAATDLQCDFNVLISPHMFDTYFLPALEQQTRWVERTIFHLDGSGGHPASGLAAFAAAAQRHPMDAGRRQAADTSLVAAVAQDTSARQVVSSLL